MDPLKPQHADRTRPVAGTPFSVRRVLAGYAYPVHGNLSNPTPHYRWLLILAGQVVDQDHSMRTLVAAARRDDAEERYRR